MSITGLNLFVGGFIEQRQELHTIVVSGLVGIRGVKPETR